MSVLASCPVGYCMSGGTCLLSGNAPYCQCLPSYTGTRCETLITGPTVPTTTAPGNSDRSKPNDNIINWDDLVTTCAPNPCLNGGACYLDMNNMATCSCMAGWIGPICETIEILTTVPTRPPGESVIRAEIIYLSTVD